MKKVIIFFILIAIIILGGIIWGIPYYKKNFANVTEDAFIYIPTNASYKQVKDSLAPHLKNMKYFDEVALKEKYPSYIKAGRYKINRGENNKDILERFLAGKQEPIHLRIKAYDDIFELASDVGKKLELDSLQFINYFQQVAKEKKLADVEELKVYFTPETYFVDWNTSPEKLFSRFEKIHNKFWNEERLSKIKKSGLSKMEVYILASIVQREYMKKDELPIIASLYLNRLRKGMKLQSDPTVIYAERKARGFKIIIKRVKNLSIDSPYNTYKYKGLPPLPICIPNDFVVDAVLNPSNTNYLFMCANPDDRGRHLFTASDVEHMKNAKRYREWLNLQGIR